MSHKSDKETTTLTTTTEFKAPVSFFATVIVCTAMTVASLVIGWNDLKNRIEKIDGKSFTTVQAQEWLENAREQNPTMHWPRLPDRRSDATMFKRDAILTRKD